MRAVRLFVAMMAATALAAVTVPCAGAEEMLLKDESPPNYEAFGWTFLSLSLLSAGFAAYSYQESQDALDDAEANYDRYEAATSQADVLLYRKRTESNLNDARDAETRANAAILLTLVFGLTTYFSFSPEDQPDLSLTWLGDRAHVVWRF